MPTVPGALRAKTRMADYQYVRVCHRQAMPCIGLRTPTSTVIEHVPAAWICGDRAVHGLAPISTTRLGHHARRCSRRYAAVLVG